MSAASRSMTTATSVRSAGMCVCLSGVGGGDGERGEEIDLVEAWAPARRQGSDRDRFKTRCCAPGGAPAGVGTCSPPRPCRPPLPTHCAGHARVYVAFDTLFRLLQDLGFDVKYVRNFTGQRGGGPASVVRSGVACAGGARASNSQHAGSQPQCRDADIDDKIIRRSQEAGRPWKDLTETFIKAFHEDMARRLGGLSGAPARGGLLPPSSSPSFPCAGR